MIALAGLAEATTILPAEADSPRLILHSSDARQYVKSFDENDEEDVVNLISNEEAFDWIVRNAPLFDCPSTRLEEIYYFRWWTYRKHICQTPHGRVLTEFITPVSHAGPYNTISCAYGHHLAEGRWLHDRELLDEYTLFWFRSGPHGTPAEHFHQYSSWAAAALYERYLVTGDLEFLRGVLNDLVADYREWESERRGPDGLFWQYDVRDGMEESISGGRGARNVRPTINSYMVANARAISAIASLTSRVEIADEFALKADNLQKALIEALWDADAEFFKVRLESGELSDAREAIGFIPWRHGVAGPEHAGAWLQIKDREGFWAPCGLTTAERRHPRFRSHGAGKCEWDGSIWPFATCQTLGGLANLLRGPNQSYVSRHDYLEQLLRYASAHQKDGKTYLGEYHDEVSGAWLISGAKERRSRYYNHSTFNDLVIHGLVGIVPRADNFVEINSLLPAETWDWFCLDGVPYHEHELTIVWDRTGERYGRGVGLSIWADRRLIANSPTLSHVVAEFSDRVESSELTTSP